MFNDNINCTEFGMIDIRRFYEEGVKLKSDVKDNLKGTFDPQETDFVKYLSLSRLAPSIIMSLGDRNVISRQPSTMTEQ